VLERFTEKARRVIFFARYEASQYGSPCIETEHLLLGLVREDKGLANRYLRNQGSIESIRKEIEQRITIRERISTSVEVPLSAESKRILAFAAEEADRLGTKHVGTEHLLLGILREEKCFGAEILQERGLRLSALREELARSSGEKVPVNRPKETSNASSKFCAAAPKIILCSSASPAWAKPLSSKASRSASRMATCRFSSPTSAFFRSIFH
jgi:ATP-dependent Clp protease ATP-binding subunit ClpC